MRNLCVLTALALVFAGCSLHHGRTDDAGPSPSDAGVVPPPMPPPPGTCGDTPMAPECELLCETVCAELEGCGVALGACIDSCYAAFACPGESPGHDASICRGLDPGMGCASACAFARNWGGWSSYGIECPVMPPPPPPPLACEGRDYCDCNDGCEPLIDLSTGCVCECDDPFNCSGDFCDCACGGARYLGCVPAGQCAVTEIYCGTGSCAAAQVVDGCLLCDDLGCGVDG